MTRDLQRRLGRLEMQDGDGSAVVPVVVYRAAEDSGAAIRRVFGARPLPSTVVLIPDNGRDPDSAFSPKDDRP